MSAGGGSGLIARLRAVVDVEVSSRSLGLARVFICTIMLYRFSKGFAPFKYEGEPVVWALAVTFLVSTILTLIGYRTRVAAAVMALSMSVLFLYYGRYLGMAPLNRPQHPFHVAIVLALTPCGRSLSIDRVRAVRRARARGEEPPPERVQWMYVELFVLMSAVMYFWAGYDKLDPGWLGGERMERIWLSLYGTSDSLAINPLVHPLAVASAWIGTATELALVPLLLWRRSRHIVMWWGIVFHLTILFALNAPDFTLLILATYVTFLHPDTVDRAIRDLTGEGSSTGRLGSSR